MHAIHAVITVDILQSLIRPKILSNFAENQARQCGRGKIPERKMEIKANVSLKKGREQSVKRRHPWVFSGAIQTIDRTVADGDWVTVTDAAGKVLGYGHYQKGTITVRLSSFETSPPTEGFWTEKFKAALQQRLRTGIITSDTNAYRLVHGEGDGLPGLIVDIYNGVAIVQAHSAGMHTDRHEIAMGISAAMEEKIHSIYYKTPSAGPGGKVEEYLSGSAQVPHLIEEHGHKFLVDWEEGQKTGFFLDQRENRKLLSDFSAGKKVLNTFCYTGGFSVYGLVGGAALMHSVDASERAVGLTRKNIELNGFDPAVHESFAADTFEFLKDKKDYYDVIILDPPAFAKHKDARHQAMKGYQRLNAEAIRVIRSGGIIFTFSCSQVVDRQLFYDTVVSSAITTGRNVKVLHQLSQPGDHPVSVYHPEGDYLKGLILYVE